MDYVLSDIHGCYEKYQRLLEKISLRPEDSLWILGDLMDRGPDSLKVLRDVMERPNISLMMGNHDRIACSVLSLEERRDVDPGEKKALLELWFQDGGEETYRDLMKLSPEEKKKVGSFLREMAIWTELNLGTGEKFFLAHTVPSGKKMADTEKCEPENFLWGKPDYFERYYEDRTVITGHTPTGFIDPGSCGRIWKGNGHIALDCGAAFGNPLGCICLETMEEFYSE